MRSLTGQWDSARFFGLFGLSVYFSMRSLTGQWDSVRFIGLFGLSVYCSMHSLTGQWDRNRFISQCTINSEGESGSLLPLKKERIMSTTRCLF